MKTHIMNKNPYGAVEAPGFGELDLYKSLCGVEEPILRCWKKDQKAATCKKCIKIHAKREAE